MISQSVSTLWSCDNIVLELKELFSLLAHNPLLQRRVLCPFSVTNVKSNLTWDWTESCSLVLAMRLKGEEPQWLSSPCCGTQLPPTGCLQEAQTGGKLCVDGGKWLPSHRHPQMCHFAALCQGLTGFRPCRWKPIRIIWMLRLLTLFPEKIYAVVGGTFTAGSTRKERWD